MITFNVPAVTGKEEFYINQAIQARKLSGDGEFTRKCSAWFEKHMQCGRVLLTPSGTHALEMAALLSGVEQGDEVIMPSYTFSSTANAFVLRGARIVFVDIRPDTMNIDENLIEGAVTGKTKAVVPMHYAGVSCEMETIMEIAKRDNLLVIEDAAQGVMSTYKGKRLGAIGHLGCYSFHETKNYHCGEGGALLINEQKFVERAEIVREKGTDRSKFFRGQVDKYTWVDIGSSYLPGELKAAYLYAQLGAADLINNDRLASWNLYYGGLEPLADKGAIRLPFVPADCVHNAHMFYFKAKDIEERSLLIQYLKNNGIMSVFHYVPLHSSRAGLRFGRFYGEDRHTTCESEKLLRLPLYYGLEKEKVEYIIEKINAFYATK